MNYPKYRGTILQILGFKRKRKESGYKVAHCLQITQNVAFDFLVFCPTKKVCSNLTTFGIFNKRLSTQNVNVARFARTVECDFFCDFQTLWMKAIYVASRARCKVRFVQSCAQAHLFFPFFFWLLGGPGVLQKM